MAQENAVKLADEIIADLSGSQHYKVKGVLAERLEGHVASSDAAMRIAEAILQDWEGARYYEDPKILAQYLESSGVE